MDLDELLNLKTPPKKGDLTDEDIARLFFKYKGLLKKIERDEAFWVATNEHITIAYSKLDKQKNELQEAQELLVRKEKLAIVGLLASSLSHELRNPLGIISNTAYLLQMELKDADEIIKKHIDLLQKEVDRSVDIITEILTFAKVKKLKLVESDLNKILEDVLKYIDVPENISIENQLDPNLPHFQLDEEQVFRAFLNIISNSLQALEDEGKIVLKTSKIENFVVINITDNGVGIPEEILDKIFEPLFTTKSRGIGLGLAIVKEIVDLHNGFIEVESEVGKETTFTIRFPIDVHLDGK
ncbi:MAG: GHKL domain-containing protein [Candidatus Heimdallarchaeota archaeon]|nr:GHKL domain-containing protein [Candidatus Heimdallarchaeota archaeon]MCK5144335.1 GHKL domain-containing protein [Candidatus Heimdallarchaeota archaeon]